tara:strand:- start:42 stop:437 length:396 start_codon:yes stop_codon:yes gene_type:complete
MKKNWITKFLTTILISILLTGCFATTEKHEAAVKSWVGHSSDHLVEKWGAPTSVYNKDDGGKILTFVRSGAMFMPGTSTSNTTYNPYGGSTTTISQSPGTTIPLSCKTSFVISSTGKITGWSYQGNHCVSK